MVYDDDIVQSIGKISSETLRRLYEDAQFSAAANNLIANCLNPIFQGISTKDSNSNIAFNTSLSSIKSSEGVSKKFDKNFTSRSAKNDKMTDIKLTLFKKSFRELPKESIETFEKEFDKRVAFIIGEEKAQHLKRNKKQHQLAFFRWIFSLCTIASLPYVDDDSTKSTGLLFS
ncbi:MAG: hypothetical protein LBQ23_01890 [Puniceicoccales bacterium]|jgi:hypothetical protein|nr:hypothetical protein [Puniceicoccales bacterium]